MKKLAWIATVCAVLSACATPGDQVKGMPEHIQTIGIASSVSPRLILSKHGFFGPDQQKINWDLNTKLVREASALLQGRYKVVPFVVNPTEDDRNKPAIERLRAIVSPGSVDILRRCASRGTVRTTHDRAGYRQVTLVRSHATWAKSACTLFS